MHVKMNEHHDESTGYDCRMRLSESTQRQTKPMLNPVTNSPPRRAKEHVTSRSSSFFESVPVSALKPGIKQAGF